MTARTPYELTRIAARASDEHVHRSADELSIELLLNLGLQAEDLLQAMARDLIRDSVAQAQRCRARAR